jgi:hypothetical protein
MSDPKSGEGFLRKVVRFVANPTTDWAQLNSRQDAPSTLELEQSELKEMVERKRRNDFVRKREFDMLRRVRREGLTPEQLAALGSSSQIDDSDAKLSDAAARADSGVKAKIDAIEQQMVGPTAAPSAIARHSTGFFEAPTEPAAFRATPGAGLAAPTATRAAPPAPAPAAPVVMGAGLSPLSGFGALTPAAPAPAPIAAAPATPPAPAAPPPSVEFSEVQHDPELDEAVIAFANADFDQCERSIETLTAVGGPRAQHVETWLARFDLYRATGQQDKFEALAVEYAQRFGWSAPQWFSLPRMVADAVAAQKPAKRRGADAGDAGAAGWSCPEVLDVDAVARLRSQTLQMPLPWVLDWSHLRRVEPDAATQLTELMRHWATQTLEMHWRAGDQLIAVLAEQSPTGERDADPAFWVARLEALRLANRPDQFDETAIDYCVTYEVSPPSWERAKCKLRITGRGPDTGSPPLSQLSEVTTTFADSSVLDDDDGTPPGVKVARVELSGQLVGGIDATLKRLDEQLGDASVVQVSCARLIRVDFLAAGDLLNWVLAKRGEGRQVSFIDAHRLVGLFFGAMGINEHARVRVRHV